jgi:hypothetical protein
MKPTVEDVRFERVGRDRLGEIAALTERDERDIEYLLFSDLNPASRAFGLLGADGRVAGFVGFVHNPFWYHGTHYQSFRSEVHHHRTGNCAEPGYSRAFIAGSWINFARSSAGS